MKVKNKGGKGNPNHDDNTGEFTSEDGASTVNNGEEEINKIVTHEDDMGPIVLTFDPFSVDDLYDSLLGGLTHAERIEESKKMLESNKPFLDMTNCNDYNLAREEKIELITSSSFGYDKEKLENLSDEEIEAIYECECIILADKQLQQKIELNELARTQQENAMANEIASVAGYQPSLYGVWKYSVTSNDYLAKSTPDETGTSAIDRKRAYYQEIIDDPFGLVEEVEDAKDKLASLNKWVQDCEEYLGKKAEIEAKYSKKIAEIDDKLTDLYSKKKNLTDENFQKQVKLSREFLGNYQDKNSAYSQERKDNATWITGGYVAAKHHFQPEMDKKWATLTSKERAVAQNYTGGGFSKFNKPLRGIKHDPNGYSFSGATGTFSQAVTELTNAIDKCTWDEDIWVQRGVSDVPIFMLPGSAKGRSLDSMTEEERNSLIGTTFTEPGFFSAGAGKSTGFSGNEVIFNTYCPKGTKMIYIDPYSNYKGENEMILQRGYSYRITKIEKKGYRYFVDIEVILGSDENKPTGNALKELGNKYYYAPRGSTGEAYE